MNEAPINHKSLTSESAELSTPKDSRPLWRKLLPFAFAIGLTGWLVSKLNLRLFLHHLLQVNYPLFLGFCCLFMVSLLTADALATSFVYRKTVAPISFKEFFLIRGASYLPSLINHHLGQAWLTWYLSRAYQAPLGRVAGATLLVYATTIGSLFLFGAVSLVFDHTAAPWLAPILGIAAVAAIGYLVVIRLAPPVLASNRLLAPLFQVGVRGHFEALALRIPHVLVLFLGTWIPFFFFGVKIPPAAAFAYMPILMVLVALPITPQGVGTRDWFCLHYFSVFAVGGQAEREAAMAASTLTFVVGISLVQAILAITLMPRALRAIRNASSHQHGTATTPSQSEVIGRNKT